MPRRSVRWIWAGRVVFVVGVVVLVVYLVSVGLDKADKVASSIGVVLALLALVAPYLLPPPVVEGAADPGMDRVENSGRANATGGGHANTGLETDQGPGRSQVVGSGDAVADGPGSVSNTGIRRQRGPGP